MLQNGPPTYHVCNFHSLCSPGASVKEGGQISSWYHPRVRKGLRVPKYRVLCAESGKVGCIRILVGLTQKGRLLEKSENPIGISI